MPLLKTEYLQGAAVALPTNPDTEIFAADAQLLPATANAKDGTIDVVWYSGAYVPRLDRSTGEPYLLKLDMEGCRCFCKTKFLALSPSTPKAARWRVPLL